MLHCLSPHPYCCLTRPRNCVVTSGCAGPAIVIKGLSMFPLERQFSEGIWVAFFFFFHSFLDIREFRQSMLIVHARLVLGSLCEC